MDKKKDLSWEEIHWIQIEEILKHKWIKSQACGRDLGDEAVKDWVVRHAADFRKFWEKELGEMNNEGIDEES